MYIHQCISPIHIIMHIHSLAEFNYKYCHAIVALELVLLSTCAIRHLLWVNVRIRTYQVVSWIQHN